MARGNPKEPNRDHPNLSPEDRQNLIDQEKNPANPHVGSEEWAKQRKLPPYDKD